MSVFSPRDNARVNCVLHLDFLHKSGSFCRRFMLSKNTEKLVTRDVGLSAAIALGLLAALVPAHASVAQDAKKICLERYNVEKDGGTLPAGMAKAKYLKQCTTSYVHNATPESQTAKASTQSATTSGTPHTAGSNTLAVRPSAGRSVALTDH